MGKIFKNKICTICGDVFQSENYQSKYCSSLCKRKGEIAIRKKYRRENRWRLRMWSERHYRKNKEQIKLYWQSPAGKRAISIIGAKQRRKFPEVKQAHNITYQAIRNGELTKLPCKLCGDEQVIAHHQDYSKPLEVIWLCICCHVFLHKILRDRKEE